MIRYRVWDGERMWVPGEDFPELQGVLIDREGGIWRIDWSGTHAPRLDKGDEDVKAMLSTGLHDKNDVEIFHSDIVRHSGLNQANIGVVEDGLVEFSVKFRWPVFVSFTFSEEKKLPQVEVIGNNHENPELLQ